jgi:hypothetical protein
LKGIIRTQEVHGGKKPPNNSTLSSSKMQKLQPCLLFADGLNCSWQTFRKAAALLAGWIAGWAKA